MTHSPPHAAVIIPHFNDGQRLARCLEALMPQAADRPVEICVVDNGSDTDPAPLIARHTGLRLLREPRPGAACSRNRGVAETRAPVLAFLDADCVPAPDWLATVLALTQPPPTAVIGGQVRLFDETLPPRSGAEAFETVFAFNQADYIARKHFSVTANLVTTRAVFAAVGPFVPGLSEDYDWCRRAHVLGYPVRYAPELQVSHPTRPDWPALRRKWRRVTAESFAQTGSGATARAGWALRAGLVAASGPVHLARVLRHPGLSPADRARAAGTLLRLRVLRAGWMLHQAATGALPKECFARETGQSTAR